MIKHHESKKLGTFDYDNEEFEIVELNDGISYIHYIGKGGSVNLPKGCINTSYMFAFCDLPKRFTLSNDFDTSEVEYMTSMFAYTPLPENFSLGDKFDTSKVKYMDEMFFNSEVSEKFTLGDKFDISNVEDMCGMFRNCRVPRNFSDKIKFDIPKNTMHSLYDAYIFKEDK